MNDQHIRRFVGWVSVAFGIGMLLQPQRAFRLFGVPGRIGMIRYLALRDLAVGLGALTRADLTPWMWARTLSDATDIMTFAFGAATGRFLRGRAVAGMLIAAGTTALDIALTRALDERGAGMPVE